MKIKFEFDTSGEDGYHEQRMARVYGQAEDMYHALHTIQNEVMRSLFVKERWADLLYERLTVEMKGADEDTIEAAYTQKYKLFEELLKTYQWQLDEVMSDINLDLLE